MANENATRLSKIIRQIRDGTQLRKQEAWVSPPDSVLNTHNITRWDNGGGSRRQESQTLPRGPSPSGKSPQDSFSHSEQRYPACSGSICTLSFPHREEHPRPSGATISSDLSPPPAASLCDFWPELGQGSLQGTGDLREQTGRSSEDLKRPRT